VSDGGYIAVGGGTAFGSELQPNSDLSGTGGTSDGAGSVIGDIADEWDVFCFAGTTATVSKDGNDYQVISSSGGGSLFRAFSPNELTSGTLYVATITIEDLTGDLDWRVSNQSAANSQFLNGISSAGTYTQYFISDATFTGTNFIAVNDGATCTISEASIKAVTLSVVLCHDSGTTIDFVGLCTDVEDGAITGTDLVWTSSLDGVLGTGVSLTDIGLTDGVHVITLTATDSASDTDTDTIVVFMGCTPSTGGGLSMSLSNTNIPQDIFD